MVFKTLPLTRKLVFLYEMNLVVPWTELMARLHDQRHTCFEHHALAPSATLLLRVSLLHFVLESAKSVGLIKFNFIAI